MNHLKQAQLAIKRLKRSKEFKIKSNHKLFLYPGTGLKKHWSPIQISYRIRIDNPNDKIMRISSEIIYQAIYVQARGQLKIELNKALRSGRAKRKNQKQLKTRNPRFRDEMLMISKRPPEMEDRAMPRYWEKGLIIGKNNQSAIETLVEHQTRYTILLHLPNGIKNANTVQKQSPAKCAHYQNFYETA